MTCPLCHSDRVHLFAHVHGRRYLECEVCRLAHLVPEQRLEPEREREHYGHHENDPADPRYRAYLSRLSVPLVKRLSPGASGLDYGSGPGPTLSVMLEEQGFEMAIYDPFFARHTEVLERTYDFITCTETVEHFFSPAEEFDQLDRMLRPGGWLGVTTEPMGDERVFEGWRYARDPTHVCFYHPSTMEWIADRYGWALEAPDRNVFLFHKAATGA